METTHTTVCTWLPLFSGFYGTWWESDDDENNEIEYINELRQEQGMEPIQWDDVQFNYDKYRNDVAKAVVGEIEHRLKDFVHSIDFEEISSPKYYNFSNDSINVQISPRKNEILEYLKNNAGEFEKYLEEQYTSRSGFISSYPNNVSEFMEEEPLDHKHKLGAILQFILLNEGNTEEDVYSSVYGDIFIEVENFNELTTKNNE